MLQVRRAPRHMRRTPKEYAAANAMRDQLRAFAESLPEGQPGRVKLSAEEAERLRELGYLE